MCVKMQGISSAVWRHLVDTCRFHQHNIHLMSQARKESDPRTGVVAVQRNAAQACLRYMYMAVACVFLQVESYWRC